MAPKVQLLSLFLAFAGYIGGPVHGQVCTVITDYNPNDVIFTLNRNGTTPVDFTVTSSSASLQAAIDSTQPLIIVVHGWRESDKSPVIADIVTAYVQTSRANVFAVNWSAYSMDLSYPCVVPFVVPIGDTIAVFMNRLLNEGLATRNRTHIVGFSLGAHVAGNAGSKITPRIARITGLDAAGPGMETPIPAPASVRLDTSDALFVDTIHTEGGVFGFLTPYGHVDFFPNGGSVQPCNDTTIVRCAHEFACKFFTESIYNQKAFYAVKCSSFLSFSSTLCPSPLNPASNSYMYMGEPAALPASNQARGTYYLWTNANPPYGRGENFSRP